MATLVLSVKLEGNPTTILAALTPKNGLMHLADLQGQAAPARTCLLSVHHSVYASLTARQPTHIPSGIIANTVHTLFFAL
jgi:hypothetical protein